MATLIFLVGVRGAGKTSVIGRLTERPDVVILQPSTTRPPRAGQQHEYDHVKEWDEHLYAWTIKVGDDTYGMRRSEVEKATGDRVCLTVFDPGCIDDLDRFRRTCELETITVGLDTVESPFEQHARVAENNLRAMSAHDFQQRRDVVRGCDAVFRGDLDTVSDAVGELIRLVGGRGGIVTKRTLQAFIKAGSLLSNAEIVGVEPASYDLRVGDEAWCQGEFITLSDERPSFAIPPYSYAIVSARERAQLPKFLSGRFDLKVSLFFNGVILSNGPQVDPGYHGALFCMLFNGRDVPRGITRGAHFATIEFTTTAIITEGYAQKYQFQQRLANFMEENSMVGPGGNLLGRISAAEQKNETFRKNFRNAMLALNGILVTIVLAVTAWAYSAADRAREAAFDAERAITRLEDAKRVSGEASSGSGTADAAGTAAPAEPSTDMPTPSAGAEPDQPSPRKADVPEDETRVLREDVPAAKAP